MGDLSRSGEGTVRMERSSRKREKKQSVGLWMLGGEQGVSPEGNIKNVEGGV